MNPAPTAPAHDPAQIDPAQIDPAQIDPAQIDPAQIERARTGPLAAIGPDAWSSVAALAAGVLAVTSTGSLLVAGVLLGLAARSRWSATAATLAAVSVGVRFGTATFDDLAGLQSVLGPAGLIEPATGAAASWAAAVAVILAAAAPRPTGGPDDAGPDDAGPVDAEVAPPAPGWRTPVGLLVAGAGGAMAAAVVAGPGTDGLATRGGATVVAVGLVIGLDQLTSRLTGGTLDRLRGPLAVAAGVVAVVSAGLPS